MKLFRPRFNQREGTPDSELKPNPVHVYPACNCVNVIHATQQDGWTEPDLHQDKPDTTAAAWRALEEYIQATAASGNAEFNPRTAIGSSLWEQIVALPRSIASLKSVKYMILYGSHLVRIPPDIGQMENLEEFDPYTSYKLHWFPYEITRCKKLVRSRVSTRALYGNYKVRPPFPRLPASAPDILPDCCSVCGWPFGGSGPTQVWISLAVATDVLPLLVHACSEDCIQRLPKPHSNYVPVPHRGGLDLVQPAGR